MQTEYTGRQMSVTQKLRTQAALGLGRIERLVGRSAKAHVILTTERHRQMAEVTIATRRHELVGTAEATLIEAALHAALEKAEKQALRHKEKVVDRKRNTKLGKESILLQEPLAS